MPYLQPLDNQAASDEARATLEKLHSKLGQVPNMYRTFAHASKVLDAVLAMGQAIRTDLAPKLRELAYLKVSQITDCHVCLHYHTTSGRRAGLSQQQIDELSRYETSHSYSDLEKDVLRFAEQWSVKGQVSADVLDRLMLALSPAQLVVLAATVAQANLTSRFNNVFGVELP